MGLLIECPQCKTKNSPKKGDCKCGVHLRKLGHKNYWIEYYNESGRRKRERIGPSKAAAEQRLRDILKARTEGRYIKKEQGAKETLGGLIKWFLDLPEIKGKASYERYCFSFSNLMRILKDHTRIKDLTVGRLEAYQSQRLSEYSPTHPGSTIRPATVNREVACLKSMVNKAVKYGILEENPFAALRKLSENNARNSFINHDQFSKLLEACLPHLKPVVKMAYLTGMRKQEVLFLDWSEVDLKQGFIRLEAERTKTKMARSIPITKEIYDLLKSLPRGIKSRRVFLRNGEPFKDIKKSYKSACKRAGLENFTFHDLRHCAINNMRLEGVDHLTIMAISGHKDVAMFKRYNNVSEAELSSLSYLNQESDFGVLDTYMDTRKLGQEKGVSADKHNTPTS
jgi:integrase